LPINHKYRKNINNFFIGRVESDVALSLLSGEELYDMVSEYDDIVRKNIKNFFIGRVESDVALSLLSGEELYEMVSEYDDIVFDFQSSKRSIFRNFFIGRLISSAITLMSCILKQICLKIFSRHLRM
jgi:molybdopterin-binding protein